MRILVACEESQEVTIRLRARDHEAWSCDTEPASGGHPEWHIQGDVLPLLTWQWDMIIGFPPCTHLNSAGALHWPKKRLDGRQARAISFFRALWDADCPRIALENPVGIMSTVLRKPDQYIQPYEFGDPESKKTGLWLKGLPKLRPTNILPLPACGYWENQTPSGQNKLGPSKDRARLRSQTYPGVADAMAAQWTPDIQEESER